MKNYWKRLKNHPGVEMATGMTVLGFFAGLCNANLGPFWGAIFGGSLMAIVCWPIVLWTARTQPLPKSDDWDNR